MQVFEELLHVHVDAVDAEEPNTQAASLVQEALGQLQREEQEKHAAMMELAKVKAQRIREILEAHK